MSLDEMLWTKDIELHIGLKKKNKNLQYTAYEGLILGWKTHIDWKWGDGKRYFMQIESVGK